MSDLELLEQYAGGSQEAFASLVRRHIDWVYCVARRRVGDPQLAEDITQAAFILLAQRAGQFRNGKIVSVWLMKATSFLARNALRAESRRRRHERIATEMRVASTKSEAASSHWKIDEAIASLPREYQRAILLRFYEQKSLAQVGSAMGISEEAARKRVSRAIEKMRGRLIAKTSATSILPAAFLEILQENWIKSSPPHLAEMAANAATSGLNGTTTASALAKGAEIMWMWNKLKIAAVVVLLALLPGILFMGHLNNWLFGQTYNMSPTSLASATDNGNVPGANMSIAKDVLIALSPDHTRAWAFAAGTGKWVNIPVPEGNTEKIQVSITETMAVLQVGNRIYGFSGVNGKMDSFDLPPGSKSTPSVSSTITWVQDGTHYWAFSPEGGAWSTIDTINN
ncbi:MAG: sigma-70 family RNA polymerase sigma factor [Tepidisphaeraceae bacterium]|jgi:RNA polymerase sigma factor (sigma-70 family)